VAGWQRFRSWHPVNSRAGVTRSGLRICQPPYATASATLPVQLPEGFKINSFAEGLESARWMAVAPNGDVFLAEQGADKVTLLRDRDGDGRADLVTTYAAGFDLPHGLASRGDCTAHLAGELSEAVGAASLNVAPKTRVLETR
jgi:glucose/arabinose dehydrogenase